MSATPESVEVNMSSGASSGAAASSAAAPLRIHLDAQASASELGVAPQHSIGLHNRGAQGHVSVSGVELTALSPARAPSQAFTEPAGAPTDSEAEYNSDNDAATPYRFAENGDKGYRILFPPMRNEAEEALVQKHVRLALILSLCANIVLLIVKVYAAVASRSLSVAASAVDSFLDLASQAIVYGAERGSKNADVAKYPAGRSRLEPVGIILCAGLMAMAALQLIIESATQLADGYGSSSHPEVDFTTFTLTLLACTIVAKFLLSIYCRAYAQYSGALEALAVDHRNDVGSNIVALIAAILAWKVNGAWSADPIGAIVMSLYIINNWFSLGREQVDLLIGRAADPEFIAEIRTLAAGFHSQLTPDLIRAYHFGQRYLVELEVVLPALMTVREAHDISLALQQSIEQLPNVERAFVHCDWRGRDGEDEHNARQIAEKVLGTATPAASPRSQLAVGEQAA